MFGEIREGSGGGGVGERRDLQKSRSKNKEGVTLGKRDK